MQLKLIPRFFHSRFCTIHSAICNAKDIFRPEHYNNHTQNLPEDTRKFQGVGCDIEEIERFNLKKEKDARFLAKVYTITEIEYSFSFTNPAPHLAARFCAKEATVKALCSVGEKPIDYAKIEIINQVSGVPDIIIRGEEGKCMNATYEFSTSLSHCSSTAMAVVLITRKRSQLNR